MNPKFYLTPLSRLFVLFVMPLMLVMLPLTGHAKVKHNMHSKNAGVKSASKAKIHVKKRYIIQSSFNRNAYTPQARDDIYDGSTPLDLASAKAIVINQNTNEVVFAKNINEQTPIASLTKLMTAMVVLDAKLDLNDAVTISEMDVDYLKGTSSRLPVGTTLTRGDLLHLALIASENRAASALATSYPGGKAQFVRAMNAKVASLGLMHTRYHDSTGLDSSNVSTAADLVKIVEAAYHYSTIRSITTLPSYEVYLLNHDNATVFKNTNILVRNGEWDIGLSKTGYISEAGRCLVMQATVAGEPLIMVFLDSEGKYTRIGDANRVRKWMEYRMQNVSAQRKETVKLSQLALSHSMSR